MVDLLETILPIGIYYKYILWIMNYPLFKPLNNGLCITYFTLKIGGMLINEGGSLYII